VRAGGIVVATSRTCEREPELVIEHACGAAATARVQPLLHHLAGRLYTAVKLQRYEACHELDNEFVCVVPPLSECEPQYTIVFSDATTLSAIIMRDDWQAVGDEVDALSGQIQAARASAVAGCKNRS
jgi:C4-type Zn-finger protein